MSKYVCFGMSKIGMDLDREAESLGLLLAPIALCFIDEDNTVVQTGPESFETKKRISC